MIRWLASVALLVALASNTAGQAPGPSIRLLFPADDDYLTNFVVLRAALEPADTPFAQVSFFADGKPVCRITQAPLECQWDAGARPTGHQVLVVASLADGRRLSASVRTKGFEHTETVEVNLVQVVATVVDSEGRFVRGLRREAFRLYEDDRPVNITYFASENIPLELISAVDISGSMTSSLPQVKLAVAGFLKALRPADVVTVLAFNENVFTAARPSSDLAGRLRAVSRLSPWGGTSLHEVVLRSLDGLGSKEGRRALVVFTDGEDTTSTVGLAAAQARAETSDATIYMIGQGRATFTEEFQRVLEGLARRSGGRAFFTDVPEELGRVYQQIIEELSHQYLLAYEPRVSPDDTAWHQLRVELPKHEYKVRARQGYRLKAARIRSTGRR